ncbi:RAD3 [Brettanomyces bruxellensis]|uniref:DNA 5'-3' helicase n=2 Tax=Dekkera bruxellensis TaxID=5007 RepID=A0A7D9D067_DEKBR|nr:RAD3 [Brettanomyces bruxellensis]
MKFFIDDLPILFPYPKIYPEQYAYMCDVKKCIDVGGNGVLEMPSGTGKTIALLALSVAYQMYYPEHRKIIYCSRTMSEIEKALIELEKLMDYRAKELGHVENFRGLGLTSRKNLCLHPVVGKEKKGTVVDEMCRRLTNGQLGEKVRAGEANADELCSWHEKLYEKDPANLIPPGVYSFQQLLDYCKQEGTCPYFTVRRMMPLCNIVIYSYHYIIDPKVAVRVSKDLSKDSIVIFDEAHNIDNVCIEALSMDIDEDMLQRATRGANDLSRKVDQVKKVDSSRLQDEYEKLVAGLRESDMLKESEEPFMENPILPSDVLQEAIPGSIRRAEHFISFMKRFIEYLKTRMKVLHVISETPTSFLQHLKQLTYIDRKPLRFCSERLSMLVRTLEVSDIEEFTSLKDIATFATLVSTYENGFMLILEPYETENATVPNPILRFTCMDASIAIKPVFDRFPSVVITSGTISPLDMYPRMLNFDTVVQESYAMTLDRRAFLPLIVTKGSDQVAISSRFEIRNDPSVVRNYGTLLMEFVKITPDGMVVFFPSYLYMESIISMWQGMGILDEVWKYKLILVETPDAQETALALETYRKACLNGRGAVLLSVARGKVSEGIDFDHYYGRTVLMIGIPFQYTESRILKARLEFLRDNYQIRENDFLSFDAMRHAAQCLGRVLRGKDDYGVMVLADRRFLRKRSQLPKWIAQGLLDANVNLSTDMAIAAAKKFLRTAAQPLNPKDQEKGVSVWNIEQLQSYQKQQKKINDANGLNDADSMSDNMDVTSENDSNKDDHKNDLNNNEKSTADVIQTTA